MHSATVPVMTRMFTNALTWLDKAQAQAEARKFDTANYLGLRLAPDMLPLKNQIQIASDTAKGCLSRLAGTEAPKWEDNEATLDDLRARIKLTLDYVQGFTPAQIDGSDGREIVLQLRAGETRMSGEEFVKNRVLPNLYFHLTTAYALLRQAGVDIGKRDFLG